MITFMSRCLIVELARDRLIIVLFFSVLYRTVLYCTALHCTALHCSVLHCTVLHYTVLQGIVLYWTLLYCTARHWIILHYTVLYCIVVLNLHCLLTNVEFNNLLFFALLNLAVHEKFVSYTVQTGLESLCSPVVKTSMWYADEFNSHPIMLRKICIQSTTCSRQISTLNISRSIRNECEFVRPQKWGLQPPILSRKWCSFFNSLYHCKRQGKQLNVSA